MVRKTLCSISVIPEGNDELPNFFVDLRDVMEKRAAAAAAGGQLLLSSSITAVMGFPSTAVG